MSADRDGGKRADDHTKELGVVLIDPHHVVRVGMAMLISAQLDLVILAEAATADEAMAAVKALARRTNVVALVGLSLTGDHDAFWLIRAIRDGAPSLAILALGATADPATVSRALFAGADGFVSKTSHPAAFLAALRKAGRGEVVLDDLPASWVGRISRGISGQSEAALLTGRERQVLSIAAEGLTARQIGTRLGLRERTITTHLAHIYRKLGAAGRIEAISSAARSGLLALDQAAL